MDVRIAGAHGQIARLLTRLLTERGDTVHGIVRKPEQAEDIRADGGTPIVLDLEVAEVGTLADELTGADAVVFAAGAGPGSGAERKWTVDHGAAVTLLDAAEKAGVRRYLMISAMGAGSPPDREPGEDVFATYLRAKAEADRELRASTLDWTIVRPGRLTNDSGTGRVELAERVERGDIPRADVAAVLAACLDHPDTIGKVFEVVSGDVPITEAVKAAR